MGIRGCAWLAPAEAFGELGIDGSAWPHGAFVYVYDDKNLKLDHFFRVTEAPADAKATLKGMKRAFSLNSDSSVPEEWKEALEEMMGRREDVFKNQMNSMSDAINNISSWHAFLAVTVVANLLLGIGCQLIAIYAWPQTDPPPELAVQQIHSQAMKTKYPWYVPLLGVAYSCNPNPESFDPNPDPDQGTRRTRYRQRHG